MYEINGQPVELSPDQVLTIADAAKLLGVTGQTVSYYIKHKGLTAVTKPGKQTARRKPKRWLLRAEVERLRAEQSGE